jgi:hypothetical protein
MSFQHKIDQTLSLKIPRVFPQWIDEQVMIDIFHSQHIGRVYKVSIIRMPDSKKKSIPIYQAYVYFSAWYDTVIAYNFQQRIFGADAQARVVYDDPWYWVVFENKTRRLSNNDKRMIRLGYQSYLNEQELVAQNARIRQLEHLNIRADTQKDVEIEEDVEMEQQVVMPVPVPLVAYMPSERHMEWRQLSSDFVMQTIGDELNLTETAMNVAEAALMETDSDDGCNHPMSYYSDQWVSRQQLELAKVADELLGDELALTETAMNVAEAALKMDDDEDDSDSINSDNIHYNNEEGDYFDDDNYNSDDPMYQTDYDSQGSF